MHLRRSKGSRLSKRDEKGRTRREKRLPRSGGAVGFSGYFALGVKGIKLLYQEHSEKGGPRQIFILAQAEGPGESACPHEITQKPNWPWRESHGSIVTYSPGVPHRGHIGAKNKRKECLQTGKKEKELSCHEK